jgi:4-hydroxy 2-oxovalerate aldolase
MRTTRVRIQDVTLRDGMHAISHQYTVDQMVAIARALDAARVDWIEVSHGDGLNGNSINYGFSRHTEEAYITAVAGVLEHAGLAALLLPGIGTVEDLRRAKAWGVGTIRIATHCTEADICRQHVEAARALDLDVACFLMMAHQIPTAALVEQARKMASYGAHCVYVTDSAGALLMDETRERIDAMKDALPCEVGFHNHNNLGLGVANTVIAVERGADRVDASLAGMGAGAGNCALEALIAVLDRMGVETGVALEPLLDAADQLVRPLQVRPVVPDGGAIRMGYAGVYSSFLLHAEKAAALYGVRAGDVLLEAGRRRMVGGQEDLLLDIARSLSTRGGDA